MSKYFHFGGERQLGTWYFRLFGFGLHLKAPWNAPLFSERYGYRRYLKVKGWRIRHLTPWDYKRRKP